jgi:hypothetical protein
MLCKLCNEEYGRQGGSFNKHLKNKHEIDEYIEYIVKVDYNNIRPVCECGCGGYTKYHNNEFKKYIHGHNTQYTYNLLYEDRPNDEIKKLYKEGKNCYEISNILKQPLTYVLKVVKENKLTRTISEAKRIYYLDQTVFDKIDTEEKAYWLGFLFADGYNNEKRGSVILTLHNRDIDILHKFTNFLNTNKPICKNTKDSSKVAIESKHMSKILSKIGMIQRKTHVLEFPDIEKHLIRHFIRGYFDGDGCVTYGKELNQHINISITSTKMFLAKLINEINDIKFWMNKRHKNRIDNIYTLATGGVCNIIKFYHYLYNDTTICMFRKKNKFEEWFNWYFTNIKKPKNKTIILKNKLLDKK